MLLLLLHVRLLMIQGLIILRLFVFRVLVGLFGLVLGQNVRVLMSLLILLFLFLLTVKDI